MFIETPQSSGTCRTYLLDWPISVSYFVMSSETMAAFWGTSRMRESGTVISVERGIAKVGFVPKEACEHCGAKAFCHPEPGKMIAHAMNDLGAEPGDMVTIETEVGASVLAAALVFAVPIAGLICGYFLGRAYRGTEAGGAVGAVCLLVLSVIALALIDRRVLKPRRFMPRITSVTRREMDDMGRDPVCGMEVPEDTPYKTEHGGMTYLFCCEACKVKFEKDPDGYTEGEDS
jgi:YHS domain-containing protein/positive regulator of sigma E activity